eukprot:5034034-Amphidinium_carterae.1
MWKTVTTLTSNAFHATCTVLCPSTPSSTLTWQLFLQLSLHCPKGSPDSLLNINHSAGGSTAHNSLRSLQESRSTIN